MTLCTCEDTSFDAHLHSVTFCTQNTKGFMAYILYIIMCICILCQVASKLVWYICAALGKCDLLYQVLCTKG